MEFIDITLCYMRKKTGCSGGGVRSSALNAEPLKQYQQGVVALFFSYNHWNPCLTPDPDGDVFPLLEYFFTHTAKEKFLNGAKLPPSDDNGFKTVFF